MTAPSTGAPPTDGSTTEVSPVTTRFNDGSRSELGWLGTTAASLYVTIAIFLISGAAPITPTYYGLALALPFGALLLTPRERLKRIVLDGPVMLICALLTLSMAWSLVPGQAIFEIRRDVTLYVAVALMAAILAPRQTIRAVLSSMYLIIIVTATSLILIPDTRLHISTEANSYSEDYPGWHGLFIHKNSMAPVLVFGVAAILLFEERRWVRNSALAASTVLMIGSQSATGFSGLVVLYALWFWFRFFHRSQGRTTTAFVVASLTVTICAGMAAVLSLSAITSAYGKDLSFSGRTDIWAASINASADSPWVGFGLGGVFQEANDVTRQIWKDVGFIIPHPHSGWLDVLLTIGLIGVVLYAVMFVSTIRLGIQLLRVDPLVGEWLLTVTAVQLLMGLSETVFSGEWLVFVAVMRAVALRTLSDRRPRGAPLAQSATRETTSVLVGGNSRISVTGAGSGAVTDSSTDTRLDAAASSEQ